MAICLILAVAMPIVHCDVVFGIWSSMPQPDHWQQQGNFNARNSFTIGNTASKYLEGNGAKLQTS